MLKFEAGPQGKGLQNIRVVVDTYDGCNLGCHYCHPNSGWTGKFLPSRQISDIFEAAEEAGLLEATLTGGEITQHPHFFEILEATHALKNTTGTFVTNATLITPDIITAVRQSNIERVCVSLDGPDAQTHDSRRGKNFDKVVEGLRQLDETGKPITVISVAHPKNYSRLTELSEWLISNGLAEQHHICAPSYSGSAKLRYDQVSLKQNQYEELQAEIDAKFDDLRRQGMFVTFNSYWPALGKRGRAQDSNPRTLTLVNVTEQVKDVYMIVRPNGDVRLTSAAWGRETVGNAVVGNLHFRPARDLFEEVDKKYRSCSVKQLPRAVEAAHKFHVGDNTSYQETNAILANDEFCDDLPWEEIRPLARIDILDQDLPTTSLREIANRATSEPERFRLLRHASGVDIFYDRRTSHLTLLKFPETTQLLQL